MPENPNRRDAALDVRVNDLDDAVDGLLKLAGVALRPAARIAEAAGRAARATGENLVKPLESPPERGRAAADARLVLGPIAVAAEVAGSLSQALGESLKVAEGAAEREKPSAGP